MRWNRKKKSDQEMNHPRRADRRTDGDADLRGMDHNGGRLDSRRTESEAGFYDPEKADVEDIDLRRMNRSGDDSDIREVTYGRNDGPSILPGMEEYGIGSGMDEAENDSYEFHFADGSNGDVNRNSPRYRESDPYDRTGGRSYFGRSAHTLYDSGYEEPDGDWNVSDPGKGEQGHNSKGPYLFISLAFGLLFLLLMGNLVRFNLSEKDEVLNSPYNKRNNSQAEYTVRGEIRSSDGATLAMTRVYEDGSEERVYPYYNEYAHVVGFATHGKSGLESFANYQLLTSHNNIIDQIINSFLKKKNPGDTVVSTLDSRIQAAAYDAMDDYRGAIIAMEPKTGAILAMVAQPNFDPNVIDETWDSMVSDSSNSQLLNRATQGKYSPGSTFKIVTALAYYRKYGTLDRFSFDCEGEIEVGNSTVHCYNGTVHGQENFYEAFAHSCNTAFSKIGLDLGAGALTSCAKDLLFGSKLPCNIAASRASWQLDSSSTKEELVQTAFGQGKTITTPYHMALLVSAIANDGVLMKPYLVDHIENSTGSLVETTKPSKYQRLMTSDEAKVLTGLMRGVVENGTASALAGRSYQVAGKTGSAEYTKSDGSMGTHSWFVGFSGREDGDAFDSDLVVVVLAENGGAGSTTAVPMASRVFRAYYGE